MAQLETSGMFQYLKGGLLTPDTGFGLVNSGGLDVNPDPRRRTGIGGNELRKGGLIATEFNTTFYVTATNQAFVGYGLRATYPRSEPAVFQAEGGTDEWGLQYVDCMIGEGSLEYSQGEGLRCAISARSMDIGETNGGDMPEETNDDFEDYEFTLAVGEDYYGITALSVKWNNKVRYSSSGDPKAAGSRRKPLVRRVGLEELTVDLTTGRPLPTAMLALWGDHLPNDLTITAVGDNDTNQVTLPLTRLQPGKKGHGLVDADSDAEWKYSFKGSSRSGSLAWQWE